PRLLHLVNLVPRDRSDLDGPDYGGHVGGDGTVYRRILHARHLGADMDIGIVLHPSQYHRAVRPGYHHGYPALLSDDRTERRGVVDGSVAGPLVEGPAHGAKDRLAS